MTPRVLVTGSAGLVGSALCRALCNAGHDVAGLDVRSATPSQSGDVRDPAALARALEGCSGIVHLAAVSRVIWGERDPAACWSTNVDGTNAVVDAARARGQWVLFASSREVYGAATELPATEDTPIKPMNIYGRSKAAAEDLVAQAGSAGLPVAIVRLSNVYGRTSDHADRVVPAFARAAAHGRSASSRRRNALVRLHAPRRCRAGTDGVIERLEQCEATPPIHFVSGDPTTLGELAALAVKLAGGRSPMVGRARAGLRRRALLRSGERAREDPRMAPRVALREGVARLIHDFRRSSGSTMEVAS